MNWNRMPTPAQTARIIRKYGSCGIEVVAMRYFVINFAPEIEVEMIPAGFMMATAIQPQTMPTAIAAAICSGSERRSASIIVVEILKAVTAKIQSFSMLKPRMPRTRPEAIGRICCQVGSLVICDANCETR